MTLASGCSRQFLLVRYFHPSSKFDFLFALSLHEIISASLLFFFVIVYVSVLSLSPSLCVLVFAVAVFSVANNETLPSPSGSGECITTVDASTQRSSLLSLWAVKCTHLASPAQACSDPASHCLPVALFFEIKYLLEYKPIAWCVIDSTLAKLS